MKSLFWFAAFLLLLAGQAAATEIDPALAHEKAREGRLVIIDIRQPEEWRATGVVAGAELIPLLHPQGPAGLLEAIEAVADGDRNAPIALICRSGNRTGRLQRALAQQGFDNVVSVRGGMLGSGADAGWIQERLPVVPCDRC